MSSLVSVLMPVYNGEQFLNEAIDSVLAQSYTNFEFIIINDGSTDNTLEILESYMDKRIRLVHQENQGVAKSLNNAIKLAQGKYIWRHDADDKCLPEQLDYQIKFLKNHKEFDLVSTQIAFMTEKGKIAWDFRQPNKSYFQGTDFVEVERSHFNPYSPITHATVLMKKEVLDNLNGYRTEFKTSEDTDLWLRFLDKHRAAVLNYCSYFVRLNATSATKKYKNTTNFYRELAFECADDRLNTGKDFLQRGEEMPKPIGSKMIVVEKSKKGNFFRSDLLQFQYRLNLNAKDYKNVWFIIKHAIKDGWKLPKTYKAIILPLLGDNLVKKGVALKQKFK